MGPHRHARREVLQAILVVAFSCSMAGCGTTPDRPVAERFERQPWARVSAEQAYAECHHAINSYALGSNMYLCMKSKGYNER